MRKEDRLLRKMKLKERVEEDVFFAARDREILSRLHEANEDERRGWIRELARSRCPECGARLARATHHDVTIEECPVGHGLWMTETELRTLAVRETSSWIARYFYRPKPVT